MLPSFVLQAIDNALSALQLIQSILFRQLVLNTLHLFLLNLNQLAKEHVLFEL